MGNRFRYHTQVTLEVVGDGSKYFVAKDFGEVVKPKSIRDGSGDCHEVTKNTGPGEGMYYELSEVKLPFNTPIVWPLKIK